MSKENGSKRSLLKVFVTPPEKVNEKEWILPRFCWYLYVVVFCMSMLFTAGCNFVAIYKVLGRIDGFVAILDIIIIINVSMITFLVWCIVLRISYEVVILLFLIFQTQRETQRVIENTGKMLAHISHTQIKSGQYICDNLAEISDMLKGCK